MSNRFRTLGAAWHRLQAHGLEWVRNVPNCLGCRPRKVPWSKGSSLCHVWTAPGCQGESPRSAAGRCSHVFGLSDAVHMTAGHNALRGSGPGQKPAFDNALAQVGCPDRRIDRLCITCCSPSNLHIVPDDAGTISFTPRVRRVPCNARPWPSWPTPFLRSCWQARPRRPSLAAGPTTWLAKVGAWYHGSWHSGSRPARPM